MTLGDLTAHGNVDIHETGVSVHLLGDYQQTDGQFQVYTNASLQVDGTFTKTGSGVFQVINDGTFEVDGTFTMAGMGDFTVSGDSIFTADGVFTKTSDGAFNLHDATFIAANVEVNTASIAFGTQAATADMMSHGTVVVDHAGTLLHVQGNYSQDGGNFHVIGTATMDVDGAFSYTAGNTFEVRNNSVLTVGNTTSGMSVANSVLVDGGSQATIGHLTAHGNVTVQNANSVLRVGGDYLQDAGGFAVGDGGTLNVDGSFRYTISGPMFINFGNGLLTVDDTLTLEEGHFWNLAASGGKVRVGDGIIVPAAGTMRVADNGTLAGEGTVVGDVINSGGTISPGGSPGRLDITDNYTQGGIANLLVEIGGTLAELQYDQLFVSGTASLAGSLTVDLVDLGAGTFAPALGQTFDVLKAGGGITGTFTTHDLPALVGGLDWDVNYLANFVQLEVIASAGLIGDYNLNGVVDAADYTVWRNTLGQSGAGLGANGSGSNGVGPAADGNGDGVVDIEDYDVWKMHFGETAGSGSAGVSPSHAAVPEPETWLIAVVAAVAVKLGSVRRGRRAPRLRRRGSI